jgi:hypothetical protein
MVCHGRDPAQRVAGTAAFRVHLADDLVLCPRHFTKRGQCRAVSVAAMPVPYRIKRMWRLR